MRPEYWIKFPSLESDKLSFFLPISAMHVSALNTVLIVSTMSHLTKDVKVEDEDIVEFQLPPLETCRRKFKPPGI